MKLTFPSVSVMSLSSVSIREYIDYPVYIEVKVDTSINQFEVILFSSLKTWHVWNDITYTTIEYT